MPLLRVLLNFTHSSDHVLEETGGHVLGGMFGAATATFPSPPVTKTALQTGVTNFTNAVAAQGQGGTAATAAKQVAADALIGLLRQCALYVQMTVQLIPNGAAALAALLSSGFDAVSTSRAQHPLATPQIKDIKNVGTGRLQLVAGAVPNCRLFEAQSQVAGGAWVSAGMFQNSREIFVTGLTPGTLYTFRLRAMGGSTGASDWSNPVSHMSL